VVDAVAFLFLLYHLRQGLQYLVVVGPLVAHQFGGDQDVVDVDFEGAYPGEDDLFVVVFVDE
jgi:hypothetical protein